MKRVFFNQTVAIIFFACSLSADVTGLRNSAEGTGTYQNRRNQSDAMCSFRPYDCHVFNMSMKPEIPLCQPLSMDALAWMLAVALPLGGDSLNSAANLANRGWPGRACVPWDVPCAGHDNVAAQESTQAIVCLVPRYYHLSAMPARVWVMPWMSREQTRADAPVDAMGTGTPGIPRLKKVFEEKGVPQKWVWMAEIESSFKPRARSSAGAVGLFQLMPDTARRFGLQTSPVDDRLHPEKNAGAAAQYLKFLRREFGCWALALAAYNAGEGRVRKIMKKRKARTFDEVQRYLPAETRSYVPKVMAIVALREDQLHGVRSACWMP